MVAFANFTAVLGAFVLWVMIWRANLRHVSAHPWYARHLRGLFFGGLAWCTVIAALIALNWNEIKAQGQRNATIAMAENAKALKAADEAARARPAAPTGPGPAALPVNVAQESAPPALGKPAAEAVEPAEPAPLVPSADQPTAALGPKATPFKVWFEKLGLSFVSSPLADGTPRQLGRTQDSLTSLELIGHGQAIEKASLVFALTPKDMAVTARNTGAVMVFMRETGWDKGWNWALESINKKTVKMRHGAVDYEMKTLDGLPLCILTATPALK